MEKGKQKHLSTEKIKHHHEGRNAGFGMKFKAYTNDEARNRGATGRI